MSSTTTHTRSAASPGSPGVPRSARFAAGRVFLVGFTCFALWLLLDAPLLYENAVASPLGARRSVAMSVLRPLARLDRVVGLSRVTSVADALLGREGTAGGSVVGSGATSSTSHRRGPTLRVPLRPDRGEREPLLRVPTSGTTPSWPPTIVQPRPSHPLVLLEIGDSMGEDLGFGLADILPSQLFDVVQDAVGDTGLSRPDYYNWPAQLSEELTQHRPQIVVVFLGANDAQSFMEDGQVVAFGTPIWQEDYAARVSEIMTEVDDAGAHLLWVGMPIMQSVGLSQDMKALNAIYAREASLHSGVTYYPSWNVFTGISGSYSEYLPDSAGSEELVRDADGVHLTDSGDDRLAQAVVTEMETAWHINT